MADKTVTCNVSGNAVTVTVTDGTNYPGSSALVTAKLLPVGPAQAAAGVEVNQTGVFKFEGLMDGQYQISVDCSGKQFGTTVIVSQNAADKVVFDVTEGVP